MASPNFFADIDALNGLLRMDQAEPDTYEDLTRDLTDIPY